MSKSTGRSLRIGMLSVLMAFLFTVTVLVPGAALLPTAHAAYKTNGKDNSTIPYDSSITSNKQQWEGFVQKEAEEGTVLLKNKDHALPIDTSKGKVKVNLLGYCAYNPVYSGSGSGSIKAGSRTDFKTSLANAGFEVNPAVEQAGFYKAEEKSGIAASVSSLVPSFDQKEVSLDKFTGNTSFDNMKKYSDIAIVVLGRNAGEGQDLDTYKSVDGRRYLQLSVNEENLLKQARKTFSKLIVVVNSANALEMGGLNAIGADAIISTGIPGAHGLDAFGKILNGTVNPSGRLVDTWVNDNDANPTSATFGEHKASNTSGAYYIDYIENIYNGYKFYETAAAEKAVIKDPKSGKTFDYRNYNSVVAYPFGSGLSYTSFSQEIKGGIPHKLKPHDTFDVKVKVKNTGKTAGKEVVELYVTVPYTKYDQNHGVEKAAVSLVGYAKTDVLQPGKSETVKVPVSMEKIASYDNTYPNANGTKGAYRLDGGKYTFSIRANSHQVLDSKDAEMDKDFVYTGADKRQSDDQQASNQFDQAERGKYLSRKNGFANYADVVNSVSSSVKDTSFQENPNKYNSKYDKEVTKHYVKGVDYAKQGGTLKYTDLKGKSYDDPQWDELLSQLTLDEMVHLVRSGLYKTAPMRSVGKPMTLDLDGPLAISSEVSSATQLQGVGHTSVPVLASTWNNDLAYTYGSYIADEAHSMGVTSWYAPAMDNHRNAYSGRNYEYYSEDATLSGGMGSNECLGARKKGLITYMKHFAFNDQENHRGENLHTYVNEQAAREIYLRPFEMAVKEGHANACMGACNMIGDVFCNDYEPLMVQVLRNEWGFRGIVSTDQCSWGLQTGKAGTVGPTYYWTQTDAMLRGGTDFWLDFQIDDLKKPSTFSDADIYYLMRAAKDILYTDANAYVIPATTNITGSSNDGIMGYIIQDLT